MFAMSTDWAAARKRLVISIDSDVPSTVQVRVPLADTVHQGQTLLVPDRVTTFLWVEPP